MALARAAGHCYGTRTDTGPGNIEIDMTLTLDGIASHMLDTALAPGLRVLWPLLLIPFALAIIAGFIPRRRRRAGLGLAALSDAALSVSTRPIWNGIEIQWHRRLTAIVAESEFAGAGLIPLAQVSAGEVFLLAAPDTIRLAAFNAINAKRFDLLVVEADGTPRLAIEVHGAGHFTNDWRLRDRIKRTLCDRAGLPLVEIHHRENPDKAADRIRACLRAGMSDPQPALPA